MIGSARLRKERQRELEALAKTNPKRVERLFREYYPAITVPPVGSLMIQNILAHEFQLEPTLFHG